MAIGDEHKEVPIGVINSINDTFYTSVPYESGSLIVFPNGIIVTDTYDDGYLESNPATGEFRMKIPPEGGSKPDNLLVRYIEA